jgi:hypothetical protein
MSDAVIISPAKLPVGGTEAAVEGGVFALVRSGPDGPNDPVAVRPVNPVAPTVAEILVAGAAGVGAPGLIDEVAVPSLVQRPDAGTRAVQA